MQTVKLSEPLKSVESPNKQIGHVNKSNANTAEDGKSFQSMLDQQLQNRQQLERQAENKKLENKANPPADAEKESAESSKSASAVQTKSTRPAQPMRDDNTAQREPFAKSDIAGKVVDEKSINTQAGTKQHHPKTEQVKSVDAKPTQKITASEASTDDQVSAELKSVKVSDLAQNDTVDIKGSNLQSKEAANVANPVDDTSQKTVMVDTPVRNEKISQQGESEIVADSKNVKGAVSDKLVQAQAKPTPASNELVKPTQAKSARVATTTMEPKMAEAGAVSAPVTKATVGTKTAPIATEQKLASISSTTGKAPVDAKVSINEIVPKQATKTGQLDAVKATDTKKVADVLVEPTTNQETLDVGTLKQPKVQLVSQTNNRIDATKNVAVDAKVAQADTKVDAKAKDDSSVMMTQPLTPQAGTKEALSSPVDAMVKQSHSAAARKKSLDKVELAKDLQAAGNEKELAEADEPLLGLKDGRLVGENPKASVRTTDFVQTFNQNALNNQVKMRGDQADVFKSFASMQNMSDVNSANTAGISNLQATVAPSTLQAVGGLMASQMAGSNLINTPFSNRAGWNQAINQKVMYMVGNGEQTARLTLNPPDLGPLQVVISVNNEKADTTFISANEDVRRALEDGMQNLRDQMDEAGVELGNTNVNTGEQFAQQQQSAQQQSYVQNTQQAVETETVVNSTPVARNTNGLVDTFA